MDLIESIPKRSAILLLGAPLSGKKEFLYSYMQRALKKEIPVLLVSTDKNITDLKNEMARDKVFVTKSEKKGLFKYIDSCSRQSDEFMKSTDTIRYISSPVALNEISIALSDIERDFLRKNDEHRVIFRSLSTVLTYSSTQTITRFLQVIIAKIHKSGGSVIFTMEEGMHDEKTKITMEHMMDMIIQVKKHKGKVMVRADGIAGFDRWKVFSG